MELQWPLILFTTFIAWSAGLMAVQACYALHGEGAKAQMTALITSFVLMVVGGIAVFFHLQHWERIFNGFGHITSGITQELIAIVVLFVVMVIYFAYVRRDAGRVPKWLAWIAIIVSVVLVAVMGHSYMMPSRPTWDTPLEVLSLLGAAAALGTGTFAVIDVAKSDAPAGATGKMNLACTLAALATTVLYVAGMAASGGAFGEVDTYFDPTAPTTHITTAAQYSPFAGPSLALTIGAIVLAALAVVFAALGKKDGKWKAWGACIVIASLAAALLLRVVFYLTGGSVFYLM